MTASLGDLGVWPPPPHLPQKDRPPGKLALELLECDIDGRQFLIFKRREKAKQTYVGESSMSGRGRWERENKESIGLEREQANKH